MENPEILPETLPQILIVEDDPSVRMMVQILFEGEGFQVLTAQNGFEALEILQTKEPALILLDMLMPVMDGWQFAAEYRQKYAAPVPIVVMTAAKDAKRRALDVLAEAYVSKPFELDDLVTKVKQIIGASRDALKSGST